MMQTEQGHFVFLADKEIGDVMKTKAVLVEDRDLPGEAFALCRPEEILHDYRACLWLKLSVQYRWPQDVEGIKKDYPQLYHDRTKDEQPWREVEPLDEAPAPCRLGDPEMFVPCRRLKGRFWAFKREPFHFVIPGIGTGPNKEYLIRDTVSMDATHAVAFVSHGGREYYAIYEDKGEKRHKRDVYAHFVFERFVSLEEVLAAKVSRSASIEGHIKRMHLSGPAVEKLTATPIDEDTFNDLDTAAAKI